MKNFIQQAKTINERMAKLADELDTAKQAARRDAELSLAPALRTPDAVAAQVAQVLPKHEQPIREKIAAQRDALIKLRDEFDAEIATRRLDVALESHIPASKLDADELSQARAHVKTCSPLALDELYTLAQKAGRGEMMTAIEELPTLPDGLRNKIYEQMRQRSLGAQVSLDVAIRDFQAFNDIAGRTPESLMREVVAAKKASGMYGVV